MATMGEVIKIPRGDDTTRFFQIIIIFGTNPLCICMGISTLEI